MVEAGVGERLHALLRQPDPGGDQIGVKTDRCAMGDDFLKIAPRGGLAAGKMRVQHAERGGLGKNPVPGFGVDFRSCGIRAPADWSNRGSRAGSDA